MGYDGARIVMTVLTWPLDLARLAATADRCAHFQTFFDPSTPSWFHAAIDQKTYRTLELDMTAAAHFMHDIYGPFNAPMRLHPPK